MTRPTEAGQPMVRTRGLLVKGGHLVCICPKCKADVPANAEVMDTLAKASVLFFRAQKPAEAAPMS